MSRLQMPDELGRCIKGDIIIGKYDTSKLEVRSIKHEYDDVYSYTCRYLNGPFAGEEITIMSYYAYRRI